MKINFPTTDFPLAETEFDREVLSFLDEWFSESETVKVQSSGSTGTPKVFETEKGRMRSSAKLTCDFFQLKKGDSALLCLPVQYISGKMMVVRAVETQLSLSVVLPSAKPLQDLEEETHFCAMSPLQVENSLDKLHLLRNLIIGGAAVSETLKNKIHTSLASVRAQTTIYETYGMSETLSHIALKQIFPVSDDYFQVLGDVKIDLDPRGCLMINAPKLNPEILVTNDLVEIKEANEGGQAPAKFRFLGRIDNVINSAGLKIYPEQLEDLVKRILPREVVFLGLPDETLGEKLILAVEGEENPSIFQKLKTVSYPTKNHQPKEIFFVKEFPRIPNGKINRLKLKKDILALK
ncbi:AMP-binding protein [Kaistella palustris]|uniref:AMP-binding protein n=1 Tax=Kaistella palustris TaxID=493376 RepID=UPI000402E0E4|nr:AMP-binding protein [Kaistella palustris]